ncbi:MAG: TolB family protein, partial [Blastocatellia bacterium]
ERLAWLAVALSLGMLGFAWAYITRQPMTNDAQVMKFSILPPEKSSFGQIAVAPDGRHLAFTAGTGGKFQLWVRALDSTEARALAGTQGATLPFWSTDSRFIGFFADGRVKKIEFTGGPVQTLYEAPLPSGGAWSRAGVILFGQAAFGLLRISATGGEVTQMTTRDISRQEIAHSFPNFLPDGRHFLYAGDGKLMAAQASRGESFEVDAAVSLFEFRAGTHQVTFAPYAVTADGQRFLINAVVETEPNAPLTVVVNWAAGAPKSNGK